MQQQTEAKANGKEETKEVGSKIQLVANAVLQRVLNHLPSATRVCTWRALSGRRQWMRRISGMFASGASAKSLHCSACH